MAWRSRPCGYSLPHRMVAVMFSGCLRHRVGTRYSIPGPAKARTAVGENVADLLGYLGGMAAASAGTNGGAAVTRFLHTLFARAESWTERPHPSRAVTGRSARRHQFSQARLML